MQGTRVDRARLAAALALLLLAGCDVTLARNLPQGEAEGWQRGLDRVGVAARLVSEPAGSSSTGRRMRIEVERSALPEALAWALRDGKRDREADERADARSEAPLIESRAEERAREAFRLARELERNLEELPGIARARVHLNLSVGSAGLPEGALPPGASVLLVRSTAGGREHAEHAYGRGSEVAAQARELVAGVVPGLASSAVHVVETAAVGAAAEPLRLQRVGPLAVTRTSATLLRAFLIGSLLLHIVLASALLWPLVQRRKQRRAEPRASQDSASR